jgi:hypothetical protein
MKREHEIFHFEDVAETLRSAEFRRADDLSRWLKTFLQGRWLVAARGELDRLSALLCVHRRTSWP